MEGIMSKGNMVIAVTDIQYLIKEGTSIIKEGSRGTITDVLSDTMVEIEFKAPDRNANGTYTGGARGETKIWLNLDDPIQKQLIKS
jgi:hypothetical protein